MPIQTPIYLRPIILLSIPPRYLHIKEAHALIEKYIALGIEASIEKDPEVNKLEGTVFEYGTVVGEFSGLDEARADLEMRKARKH